MALPSIFDDGISLGILVGLIGGGVILWAKPSLTRMIGALLFSLLFPTVVFAGVRTAQQEGSNWVLLAGVGVAAVGYAVMANWTVRNVSSNDATLAQLNGELDTLREQNSALNRQLDAIHMEAESKKPLLPAKVAARFWLPNSDTQQVVFVQGGISDILGRVVTTDVVVNSENDYMMLGRPFDKNVSGALRDLDAVKNQGQRIQVDALHDTLHERLKGESLPVGLGSVFETKTTELKKRGVKYVLHVATVQPGVEGGFTTLSHSQLSALFSLFIQNCLVKCKNLLFEGEDITSMLFPLIGAGDGGVPAVDSARWMVKAIAEKLSDYRGIREIYIVAYRKSDLEALLKAAKEHLLTPVE